MKLTLVLSILFLLNTFTFAQEKHLTLEDVITDARTRFRVEDIKQLQWIGESDSYCFVDSVDNGLGLLQGHVDKNTTDTLLLLDSLNSTLQAFEEKTLNYFPRIQWNNRQTFRFLIQNQWFEYNLPNKTLVLINKIDGEAENVDIEPHSKRMAFTRGKNLFIAYDPQRSYQITFDEAEGISNGNNYVHRNEFGIYKGTFWSPRGNYIAYYRLDQSMVTKYPLVHIDERPAQAEFIRYPMTGMTSEQVKVGIYNLKTGSIVFLQTGEPRDQYLTNITWSPDEKYIYVAHLNRDQNHMRLVKYDPVSGRAIQTMFDERDDKYVEPEHGPIFMNDDPSRFLWFSERDGFQHLYLYSANGKLIRQATKGNFDVLAYLGCDHSGKYIFVTAASADGLDRYAYRVKLSSSKMEKLTTQKGTHTTLPSKSGKWFINRFSDLQTPRRITIIDDEGQTKKTLLNAPNPLADYNLAPVKIASIEQAGTKLNYRIILPPALDMQKKYPVIVYVYGGPHAQLVRNTWLGSTGSRRYWFQYLAQEGFIIFTLDNRGSANRGITFEQATFRKLGTVEVEDQMAGINYLKSLSYVDSTRIGVHGWSYGGFMTISLTTRRPGVFKAAVAGGAVTDWRYYEVMYGERYMDTPQANPEGYAESSTFNYVDNLQGKLLLIHGTADPVVVWQHTLLYLQKAVSAGKQVDYFVYPEHQHGVSGKDRLHLYEKITEYLREYLK